MKLLQALIVATLTALLVGCDDTVSHFYPSRVDAQADELFDKGWLPEIIPMSSKAISMSNDLDLNTSDGEFRFDPDDHDNFVGQLERTPANDKDGSFAYTHEDWTFWIGADKKSCTFYMRLNRNKKPSEQGADGDAEEAF